MGFWIISGIYLPLFGLTILFGGPPTLQGQFNNYTTILYEHRAAFICGICHMTDIVFYTGVTAIRY